jgi:hypothetical protein
VFCALYSDRASHFFVTPKAGEPVDKYRLTQVGRVLKELSVQMIPAYSPQARGRSERSFGTWQGRLPQELRLAGITTREEANRFLRDHYVAEFNAKFTVAAAEKGSAFRRPTRSDLEWIFTVQTERAVAKDNTFTLQNQIWQIDQTRWRHSLAGCTVSIHEHLDETISVRYGPHVVGRYDRNGDPLPKPERRGKDGAVEALENQKQVSHRSHRSLEISPTTRDSHFPTAPAAASPRKAKKSKPGERAA